MTVTDPYFSHSAIDSFAVIADTTDLMTRFHLDDLQNVMQMQLANNKIFALSSSGDFYVLDSGPTPGQINSYLLGGARFIVDGNLMAKYGVSSTVSLYLIDSNYQPVYIGDIPESVLQSNGRYSDVHFRSNLLIIPAAPRDLRVYDISDPYNPVLVNSYVLPPLTRDVVFEEDLAVFYTQFPTIGLVTFDLNTLSPLDSLTFVGQSFGNLEISGDKIFMLEGSLSGTNVQIVDASQPDDLQLAGVINVEPVLPGMGFDQPILEMSALGDTLLLGLKDGIVVYDVGDPHNPREIAGRRSGLEVLGMAWEGPLLYMVERGDTEFGAGYYVLEYDSTITGFGDKPPTVSLPSDFKLYQNYPNPFNPTTTISWQLPVASQVELTIYNLLGQKIRTLVDGRQPAGFHQVEWDGRDDAGRQVASGVYFYRLTTVDGFRQSRKMLLLK